MSRYFCTVVKHLIYTHTTDRFLQIKILCSSYVSLRRISNSISPAMFFLAVLKEQWLRWEFAKFISLNSKPRARPCAQCNSLAKENIAVLLKINLHPPLEMASPGKNAYHAHCKIKRMCTHLNFFNGMEKI